MSAVGGLKVGVGAINQGNLISSTESLVSNSVLFNYLFAPLFLIELLLIFHLQNLVKAN